MYDRKSHFYAIFKPNSFEKHEGNIPNTEFWYIFLDRKSQTAENVRE